MGLLKELLHDKIGRIGLIGVFIVLLTALFAPLIAPPRPCRNVSPTQRGSGEIVYHGDG